MMVQQVSMKELEGLLADGALLVDVQEEGVKKPSTDLPSRHLPLSRLGELTTKIPRDRPTVFCCRSGLLSYQAAAIARDWTEQPVYYLKDGLLGYESEEEQYGT